MVDASVIPQTCILLCSAALAALEANLLALLHWQVLDAACTCGVLFLRGITTDINKIDG
jgi:hypothetical protein